MFDWTTQRVIVTGGGGFLGSAVVRALEARGLERGNMLVVRSREFDLTTREGARRMLSTGLPGATMMIHCAGAVGGIQANKDMPGRFFFENAVMAMNVAEELRLTGLLASGCVMVMVGSMTSYPGDAVMPLKEAQLWRGYPDLVSAPYAVAKLAAWQMLEAYRLQYGLLSAYVIPVNLYGPGDNIMDVKNAHVCGSLVKRFVDARQSGAGEVVCWGTGSATREFLYVDDAAAGVLAAAERMREPTPINLGSGQEVSIRRLAEMIAELSGYRGRITWDTSKPDGQARRSMDCSRAAAMLDWRAAMPMDEGLRRTIAWYGRVLDGAGQGA
jgi:GDP-L-fucose synthase